MLIIASNGVLDHFIVEKSMRAFGHNINLSVRSRFKIQSNEYQ